MFKLKLVLVYQLFYAFDKEGEGSVDKDEDFVRDSQTLITQRLEHSEYFGLPNRSRHLTNFKIPYDIPE